MRKKTLVTLTLTSAGLYVVGISIIILTSVLLASTLSGCSPDCSSPPAGIIVGFIISYLMIIAASIVSIVAWIGMLIKQAKQQQWGWFVCTLLFGYITMIIYLIAVPEVQELMPVYYVPAPGQPYPPVQPYQYQAGQAYPPMQAYYPYQPGAMQQPMRQDQPPWQG